MMRKRMEKPVMADYRQWGKPTQILAPLGAAKMAVIPVTRTGYVPAALSGTVQHTKEEFNLKRGEVAK